MTFARRSVTDALARHILPRFFVASIPAWRTDGTAKPSEHWRDAYFIMIPAEQSALFMPTVGLQAQVKAENLEFGRLSFPKLHLRGECSAGRRLLRGHDERSGTRVGHLEASDSWNPSKKSGLMVVEPRSKFWWGLGLSLSMFQNVSNLTAE